MQQAHCPPPPHPTPGAPPPTARCGTWSPATERRGGSARTSSPFHYGWNFQVISSLSLPPPHTQSFDLTSVPVRRLHFGEGAPDLPAPAAPERLALRQLNRGPHLTSTAGVHLHFSHLDRFFIVCLLKRTSLSLMAREVEHPHLVPPSPEALPSSPFRLEEPLKHHLVAVQAETPESTPSSAPSPCPPFSADTYGSPPPTPAPGAGHRPKKPASCPASGPGWLPTPAETPWPSVPPLAHVPLAPPAPGGQGGHVLYPPRQPPHHLREPATSTQPLGSPRVPGHGARRASRADKPRLPSPSRPSPEAGGQGTLQRGISVARKGRQRGCPSPQSPALPPHLWCPGVSLGEGAQVKTLHQAPTFMPTDHSAFRPEPRLLPAEGPGLTQGPAGASLALPPCRRSSELSGSSRSASKTPQTANRARPGVGQPGGASSQWW